MTVLTIRDIVTRLVRERPDITPEEVIEVVRSAEAEKAGPSYPTTAKSRQCYITTIMSLAGWKRRSAYRCACGEPRLPQSKLCAACRDRRDWQIYWAHCGGERQNAIAIREGIQSTRVWEIVRKCKRNRRRARYVKERETMLRAGLPRTVVDTALTAAAADLHGVYVQSFSEPEKATALRWAFARALWDFEAALEVPESRSENGIQQRLDPYANSGG